MSSYSQFDFPNHQAWQNYLKNVYPIPTQNQIEKIKRKWYKNNIDSSFDIEFDKKTNQENNQNSSHSQQSQSNANQLDFYYKMEGILKIFYFLMLFWSGFQAKLSIAVISLLQLRRTYGLKFTKQYLLTISKSEFTANFLYVVAISVSSSQESFLILLAPSVHIMIGLIEFYQRSGITFLQKYENIYQYINFVKINRNYLLIAKSKIEISILLYLIGLWIMGKSSIIQVIMFLQFLALKYKFNDFMKIAHQEINEILIQKQPTSIVFNLLIKIFRLYDKFIKLF